MIRITPKINVSPEAISAYTPPVRMPKTTASRTRVTGPSWSPGEGGLGVLRLRNCGGRWIHRDRYAGLPLDEEACAARLAEGIEGHRALDGLVRTAVQGVDERRVGNTVRLLRRLIHHLAHAVRLSGVGWDRGRGTAVLGHELTHERRVVRRLGARPPSGGDHHTFGVGEAYLVREVTSLIR